MAAEGIEAGPDVIAITRLHVPGTEQVDAGHFQSQPARLPVKVCLRRAEQTRSENLRLLQTRGHQPPGLSGNFTAFTEGAHPGDRTAQLPVHHDATGTGNTAGLGKGYRRAHAGGHYHAACRQNAAVGQRDAIGCNTADAGREFAVNAALTQMRCQQPPGLCVKLLLHKPFAAVYQRDVVTMTAQPRSRFNPQHATAEDNHRPTACQNGLHIADTAKTMDMR